MSDQTESKRRELVSEINTEVSQLTNPRAELEAKYGQCWDTQELQADYSVQGFMAPFVVVSRKADGVRGTLMFSHSPRFYHSFSAE